MKPLGVGTLPGVWFISSVVNFNRSSRGDASVGTGFRAEFRSIWRSLLVSLMLEKSMFVILENESNRGEVARGLRE